MGPRSSLHFAPYAVHTPIMPNDRYAEHYESLPNREAAYATMIESVDTAVGELLDRLAEHGIEENTIVVVSSDNGGLSAHARDGEPHMHNAPLRSGKGSAYEGGTRVPGIVRWPGVTRPGSRIDTPVVTHDWFPTLLEAAGATSLISPLHHVDGRNLHATLAGEPTDLETARVILWHQPHQWGARGPGILPYTAIRQGDWKLIFRHADGGLELYDLSSDLGERNELSTLQPERTRAMAALLSETARAHGAQASIDTRTGQAVPWPDEKDDRRPAAPDGMTWIPSGTFTMGSSNGYREERPEHQVTLDGFFMDTNEVTNAQFARFVENTGYVTVAERTPEADDYPDAPAELLVPASAVFKAPPSIANRQDIGQWWSLVPDAHWRHPEGPGTSIDDRMNHPVVHIAWDDAQAYAEWAGKQLPTEAQWEYAARGGLEARPFTWGDEYTPDGTWMANTWQGRFPVQDDQLDGHGGTAPVGSFPSNGWGLHDMAGNAWEWCEDWYSEDWYERSGRRNPTGPAQDTIVDTASPAGPRRITRGGSFLCSPEFCIRYRPAARMPVTPDSSLSHTGFRCVPPGTSGSVGNTVDNLESAKFRFQFPASSRVLGDLGEVVHLVGILVHVEELPLSPTGVLDEFPAIGAHTPVRLDVVDPLFEVLVIDGVAPWSLVTSLQERPQAGPLHAIGRLDSAGIEKGLGKVEVLHEGILGTARSNRSRPTNHQRRPQ